MIADDFTGALDAGVQFAKKGFSTKVLVHGKEGPGQTEDTDVLVVDAETRHKTAEEAYKIVYGVVRPAVKQGVQYLFKKTDSALRGNIGAELTALLDAAGGKILHFLPAFPQMNRMTVDGIHYIDGVPVKDSVFGVDPFEPVTTSNVEELIHQQCRTRVQIVPAGGFPQMSREKTIAVYNCMSDGDMEMVANHLKDDEGTRLIAGCAGFAEIVPRILGWENADRTTPELPPRFLVVCGSVNPITVKQLDYAEKHGFVRIRITPEQALSEGYFGRAEGQELLHQIWEICSQNEQVIIDTNDPFMGNAIEHYAALMKISREEIRTRIPAALGTIVGSMVQRGLDSSMLLTGGDTLLGCIHNMDNAQLTPVCEFETGIVLSELVSGSNKTHVFTKSGGFGDETLLVDMAEKICGRSRQGKEAKG